MRTGFFLSWDGMLRQPSPKAYIMPCMRFLACASLLVVGLIYSGCAKRAKNLVVQDSPPAPAMDQAHSFSHEPRAESFILSHAMQKSGGMPSRQMSSPMEASAPDLKDLEMQPPSNASTAPAARLVHHSGEIVTNSTEPKLLVDSAISVAKGFGGFVEMLRGERVVLRIPVARFTQAFDSLLHLGTLVRHERSAEDVTEQYQDVGLRLSISAQTIERLKALVDLAEKDEEKLRLLGRIKQLREEMEVLDAQRKSLKDLADFSRLVFHVLPHSPEGARTAWNDVAELRWLHNLKPVHDRRTIKGDYLPLATPRDMVTISKRTWLRAMFSWLLDGGRWRVGSAGGSELRAMELENLPRGDSEFWRSALKHRQAERWKKVDSLEAGEFRLLRMEGFGPQPEVYLVGFRARNKKLHLVEAYFPSLVEEQRYGKGVMASLAGGVQ